MTYFKPGDLVKLTNKTWCNELDGWAPQQTVVMILSQIPESENHGRDFVYYKVLMVKEQQIAEIALDDGQKIRHNRYGLNNAKKIST